MFIGHFGLSFAAKKAAPNVSLGTLFIATQFVDILWPLMLVLNIEQVAIVPGYTESNPLEFIHYPYTHSLFMGIVWGAVIGLIYWLMKRDVRDAFVVGLCVLSHWFLDVIVHVADLPLTPFGDVKVGFGLWNHLVLTLTIESVLFFAGTYVYATFTKPKNKVGTWVLWILAILLVIVHLSNTFGPPPPNNVMIVFVSLISLMAILIGLAYWTDRNREIR